MTALVSGEVQRTISVLGRQFAGLQRENTHEADRKDLGDFNDHAFLGVLSVERAHQQELTQSSENARASSAFAHWRALDRSQT